MAEKAQVGDLIRVVNAVDAYGAYENGDILEVEYVDSSGEVYVKGRYFDEEESIILGGDRAFLCDLEYVIHRKAGEEDEFKAVREAAEAIQMPPVEKYLDIIKEAQEKSQAVKEDEKPKHYCDACRKELGELCCTSSFGGRFCSAKCADDYVEYKQALADRNDEIKANKTQADHIRKAGKELTELLVRKNHDYGDSFAKQYEKYGLMSALIRMDDKMRRLETLLGGTDAQVDESVKDSLLDLAGYALLASVEAGKEGVK